MRSPLSVWDELSEQLSDCASHTKWKWADSRPSDTETLTFFPPLPVHTLKSTRRRWYPRLLTIRRHKMLLNPHFVRLSSQNQKQESVLEKDNVRGKNTRFQSEPSVWSSVCVWVQRWTCMEWRMVHLGERPQKTFVKRTLLQVGDWPRKKKATTAEMRKYLTYANCCSCWLNWSFKIPNYCISVDFSGFRVAWLLSHCSLCLQNFGYCYEHFKWY